MLVCSMTSASQEGGIFWELDGLSRLEEKGAFDIDLLGYDKQGAVLVNSQRLQSIESRSGVEWGLGRDWGEKLGGR